MKRNNPMKLTDLGQGYHMVPLKDHVKLSKSRWSVRVWARDDLEVWDYDEIEGAYINYIPNAGPKFYIGSSLHNDYASAKQNAQTWRDRGYIAVIYSPRNMRKNKSNGYLRKWLLDNRDVMAIQASMILRLVREDLKDDIIEED